MKYQDIKLRALEPEDLELLYQWENIEEFWSVSNTLVPYSRYTIKRYLETSHKNLYETGQLRLMIDYLPENKTIGTIDLYDFDHFHQRAGIGILIADSEYRKRGLASMALTLIIDYAFNTLHLHQIYCNVIENNRDSLDLFKKHNFVVSGIKKGWIKSRDGYIDEIMLQLINSN